MNGIKIIIKSLQDVGILINGFSKTVKNEIKEQKCEFLGTLLREGVGEETWAGTGARRKQELQYITRESI